MTSPMELTQQPGLSLEFGVAEKLSHYRNRIHRSRCASAANRAVTLLGEKGVEARIFGPLTGATADFQPGSSIDLCIFDDNPLNSPEGPRYRDIMLAVSTAGEGMIIQVHFLSRLSPAMGNMVRSTGLPHID